MQEHREPGGAFDQGPDRRALESENQVAFPMPRHRTVVCFGWAFTDRDFGRDELPASPPGPGPRNTQRSNGPQTGHQFPRQGASALDIERLVDGFVGDPHRLIIGEIDT